MRIEKFVSRLLIPIVLLSSCWNLYLTAAESEEDEIFTLPAFNITVYTADIPVVDGHTGREYNGDNITVWEFAQSFNKLLLAYHKKLVMDEVKHMKYRLASKDLFEKELGSLLDSFGYDGFNIDKNSVLTRENAIVHRLISKPFFKIDKLVVWDLDQLNQIAPEKPKGKYAKDIHYNTTLGKWERRVTTTWNVAFRPPQRPKGMFMTEKMQGLNLDTLKGFHFIERGLPANVPPYAFKDVSLTYPMFYSSRDSHEERLKYLKNVLVANLRFIYDPFSWVARRETRFRGGFSKNVHEFLQEQRIYVRDRKWFDQTFARFLSDIVTVDKQGLVEIFDMQMEHQHFQHSPRVLGLGLDLLNWNRREKREAKDEPITSPIYLGGFRHVLISAYMRYGESFVDQIRMRLDEQKQKKKKVDGRKLLKEAIEEVSGQDYDSFANASKRSMEHALNQVRERLQSED